jgi:hypothetical protein
MFRKNRYLFFKNLTYHTWWIILFFLFSFVGYKQIVKKKQKAIYKHEAAIFSLEKKSKEKKRENKELLLQINSQSDSAWIEKVLMRELGVVPEGKLKVHFTNKK